MSYLKDREIWLSSVPTGNPPAGYFWVFVQNGVLVVRDSNGVDKIMASTAGSITTAATASYVQYTNVANKPTLVSGSSQISFTGITNKPTLVSGSAQITYSGVSGKPAGIVSSSVQVKGYNVFATTGSNQFNGSQAITGSLTVTGQVVAQTLNVQQVTSSIVYSSGSNVFGNSLSNTQQFTGSVSVTGSLAVAGAFSSGTLTIDGANNRINSGNELRFYRTDNAIYTRLYDGGNANGFVLDNRNGEGFSFQSAGTNQLRIASTGAATFLSSITAGGIISTSGTGVNASVRINNTTSSTGKDWHLYSLNNGNFGLYNNTDGSYAYQVTPAGNLGLGVTPSAWWSGARSIQIGLGGSIAARTSSDFAAVELSANQIINTSAQRVYIGTGFATLYEQFDGAHKFLTASSGTAGNAITFTQAMTLDASGRLGIGATSPQGLLQIGVNALSNNSDASNAFNLKQTSTTAATGIYLERSGERKGYYMYIGGSLDSLTFQRNNAGTKADVMSLTRDGNIGIGTDSPATLLQVVNNSDNSQTFSSRWTASGFWSQLEVRNYSSNLNNQSSPQFRIMHNFNDGLDNGYIGFHRGNGLNGGFLSFAANGAEKVRITADNYLRMAAGTDGIQFNGDTSSANALDDYEEGSFTPTIIGSSTAGTATYSAQNGLYTKIGRAVSFNIYIDWSGGTGSGNLRLSGLPFTASSTGVYPSVAIGEISNIALSANTIATARVQISTNEIWFGQAVVGGGSNSSLAYDSAGYFTLSGTYYV